LGNRLSKRSAGAVRTVDSRCVGGPQGVSEIALCANSTAVPPDRSGSGRFSEKVAGGWAPASHGSSRPPSGRAACGDSHQNHLGDRPAPRDGWLQGTARNHRWRRPGRAGQRGCDGSGEPDHTVGIVAVPASVAVAGGWPSSRRSPISRQRCSENGCHPRLCCVRPSDRLCRSPGINGLCGRWRACRKPLLW
jgi:hypothetical protein